MRGSTRSWASGSSSQRLFGDRQRVRRVARRPTAAGPGSRTRVGVEQVLLRAARPALARPSPTSGRGCRCRRGPCTAWRNRSRTPRRAGRRSAGRRGSGAGPARRRGPAARSAPGTTAARTTTLPAFSSPLRGRLGVHRSSAAGPACDGLPDRPQRSPAARAARRRRGRPPSGCGPQVSCRNADEQLGQPLRRVRVVRAVLAVAVQRQVGQHDAVAVRELVDDRLELAVGEPLRVQQRQRRARFRPRGTRSARRRGGGTSRSFTRRRDSVPTS